MKCRTPSFAIIDALYAAGADINLLTASQRSPLQILVDTAEPTSPEENYALRSLVRHLVQDLQASILRRDEQMETCLHLAAERGSCREVLEALVSCDVGGTARELRNKRS
jgi:ankyrin repeat protein